MTVVGPQVSAPSAGEDRALLAAIVDATEQAVVSVDLSGRVTSWNRGAEALYGWSAREILGRSFDLVLEAGPPAREAFSRVAAGEVVAGAQVARIRIDGSTVMVSETVAPVRDDAGEVVGVAMIARDITDRLAAEALLDELRRELDVRNQDLERSNRDLEQFAYVASHDLSEPLRAVAGMVGLLGRRYQGQLDTDADEFIEFAIDGCERMRQMIADLLAYSRAGRVQIEVGTVELADLVAAASDALASQIDDVGATVAHGPLPAIRGDRSQLARVLQNLFSNALKFRRPDSSVCIEVTAEPSADGPGWRVEVSDDGIGIEEQYRERIFRMFQRLHTSDTYPGTGIGLSISERIVQQHGGSMGVEGNERGGSTFWFTLPEGREGLG